jgi:hypothetical protein
MEYIFEVSAVNEAGLESDRSDPDSAITLPLYLENSNDDQFPGIFKLYQNYPNPFNPTTKIKYQIHQTGIVTIKIFNILGETVSVLMDEKKIKGTYNIHWNGTDKNGKQVSGGVYFYQLLLTNDRIFTETQKMLLLK